MKEKYIKIKDLSVSKKLLEFINKELLSGTKINKKSIFLIDKNMITYWCL